MCAKFPAVFAIIKGEYSLREAQHMANSKLSKQKILYIYDYFMHEMDSSDLTGVTMQDIIEMLRKRTGEVFERKSIYSDISKINEYVADVYGRGKGDFIYSDGKRYCRGELDADIDLDEARLISDSLRTTEFVPEEIYRKFENQFPAYFNQENNSDAARLYSRYVASGKNANSRINKMLSFIRGTIENSEPIIINYGYKVTNSVNGKFYVVTPIVLDWTNSHYYLVAVDNMEVFKTTGFKREISDRELSRCLKRFRLDRIDNDSAIRKQKDPSKFLKTSYPELADSLFKADGTKLKADEKHELAREYLSFHGFSNSEVKRRYVNEYLMSSYEGYSAHGYTKSIRMSIEAKDPKNPDAWKNVLQAFSVLKDEFTIQKGSILEAESAKRISFVVEAPDVPPLYKILFSLYTFDPVKFTIENEEIREKLKKYIEGALASLQ